MWSKESVGAGQSILRAQHFLNQLHPNESHGLEGDCINPKCDYHFTPQDLSDMEMQAGWFTCPKCGWSYNYLNELGGSPGGYTRAGLGMTEMGNIGENLIARMGSVPQVGQVIQYYSAHNNPVDFQIGKYGVEVKTNHSESQPRFRLVGGTNRGAGNWARTRAQSIEATTNYCQANGMTPAMIGVRLNFYTDYADIFFREGLADVYIGSKNLLHVATVDFRDLNPFPNPTDVPLPQNLPEDDSTPADDSDIPF